jgi:hypothetical protein
MAPSTWNNASVVATFPHKMQYPDAFFVLEVAGLVSYGFTTDQYDVMLAIYVRPFLETMRVARRAINLIATDQFVKLVQSHRLPCGCVLDWDGKALDLVVCDRHRKEYQEAYGLKPEEVR